MITRTLFLSFLSTVAFLPAPQEPSRDYSKSAVELPLESSLPRPNVGPSTRVAPGLVCWNADFDAACAAAKLSHKPVLLFQLLGRLDEEFC